MSVVSLVAVLVLAGVHMFAGRLHRASPVRPAWLTAASGMSVAYVFMHLLPELGEAQAHWLEARPERRLGWLESQVYVAALLGVILSLALERRASTRRSGHFWLHVGSFAVYNALIGGFALRLHRVVPALLAVVAFGAHFLVNDHALNVHYGRAYERVGRWVLAASLLFGWLLGTLIAPPVVVVASVLGIVAGGIMINVIKDELPERGDGVFSAWVAGAVSYTALLLALMYTEHR